MPLLSFRPALLALLLALPALGGCFQLRALLRLNADGSGTIEETVALSRDMPGFHEDEGPTPAAHLFNEDALRAHAAALGPGVTFVRVDTLDEAGVFGYRAVYRFEDIEQVTYTYHESPVPSPLGEAGGVSGSAFFPGTDPARPLTFGFTPGRLTVRMPAAPPGGAAWTALDPGEVAVSAREFQGRVVMLQREAGEENGALLRQMLDTARLTISVELPAPATGGTARHADGTTLTLSDVSYGAVFDLVGEKPELFARSVALEARGTPDLRPLFRALSAHPGVRYEPLLESTVEWRE